MIEKIGNRPDDGAWIHSALDDFGLSVAEFRVYCHILRRAGTSAGHYWEGAKNAAKHCRINRTTYDKAIINLERYQMIHITRRKGESSIISPLAKNQWQRTDEYEEVSPKEDVPSSQNRDTQKETHPTPKEDVPSSRKRDTQKGVSPKEGEGVSPKEGEGVSPKEGDEVYPIEVNPIEVNPKEKRERDARSQKKPVENSSSASDSANQPDPLTDGSFQKTETSAAIASGCFDERVWAESKNLDTDERRRFWDWLKAKVNKMPNPPANPAQVARSFIRMDGDELLQQFRDEINAARNTSPAIQSQPIIPNLDTDHRLFRLQSEWRLADELARKTIATEIASKPEWGIAIGPHGPEKILVPLTKTDHGDLIGKMEAQLVKLQMTKRQAIAYMVEARLWDKTCDRGTLTDDQLQQLTDTLATLPRQTVGQEIAHLTQNLGANR